ncbi:MAG: DMT family transporter [Acidobacteria bacterium]|nr:DMT family transporter [Acidobacteriota bacterium]
MGGRYHEGLSNPYLLLTLTAAIWGSSWMAGSVLSREGVAPIYSSLGRFGFGALGLLLIMWGVKPWPRPERAVWIRLAAMGFLGVALYNICFFSGLKTVPSGRASLMASLQPSLIFIYSRIVWGEKVTLRKLGGLLLSLIGAGLVLTQGEPGKLFAAGLGSGDVWILTAVLAWFGYTILGRDLANRLSPLAVTAYSIWIGLGMLLAYVMVVGGPVPDLTSVKFWGITMYLGFLGTTLAFLLYLRGLEQIGAARTSIFINLVPVFSVVTSNVLLREPITWPTVVGGMLCLTGVQLLVR